MEINAEALISYRKAHNLTQEDFAKKIGVSKNTIFNYEKGGKIPEAKIPILRTLLENKIENIGDGKIIYDDSLVPAKIIIIPIKGFAGLQRAFFEDQYIEQNFQVETVMVKPDERGTYLKIQVEKNCYSMANTILPDDWTWNLEISKMDWLDKGTFKPDKIYCLFHYKRGILFKRISKILWDQITLSSDNPDKVEYPDETFDLTEFSKILQVKKIERKL